MECDERCEEGGAWCDDHGHVPAEGGRVDEALADRDERVESILRAKLNDMLSEARDARDLAAWLEREAKRILDAARGERWYELEGVLTARDVESLCNVSPTDLLGEYTSEVRS